MLMSFYEGYIIRILLNCTYDIIEKNKKLYMM